MGHINNTRYLTFVEDARTQWFDRLPSDKGYGSAILARMECDYIQQARTRDNDRLRTVNTVLSIGRSSVRLQQDIQRMNGEVVNRAVAVMVHFDYDANTSRPWTDEQRVWMKSFAIDDSSFEQAASGAVGVGRS